MSWSAPSTVTMRELVGCCGILTLTCARPAAGWAVLHVVLLEVTELAEGVKRGLAVFDAGLLPRPSRPCSSAPGACGRLGRRHPVLT